MATVVNNPPADQGSGLGILLVAIVVIALVAGLFYYGSGSMRGGGTDSTTTNTIENTTDAVEAPAVPDEAPDMVIPENIDVNVNTPDAPQE